MHMTVTVIHSFANQEAVYFVVGFFLISAGVKFTLDVLDRLRK